MLLIPLFIIIFFSTFNYNFILATLIFILAGITDVLDGYLARKYNKITKIGQVMDPLADKLMQITVLTCLTIGGYIPIFLIIIIGIKEIIMIIGGIYIYFRKEKLVIPANKYGKIATILFYIAVILISLPNSEYFFYVTILFSILAFIQYFIIAIKKIKIVNKNNRVQEI